MLTDLTIHHYALIESLHIEFEKGLNVLTGETGAGKSIVIDALGLLLGDKASASIVRKGASRCEVTGIFDLNRARPVHQFLKSCSLQNSDEEQTLMLRREVDTQGKSRAFINDKPVNLSTLSELGEILVDIHGQHEHQRLLKPNEQRSLLDRYAENDSLLTEVANLYDLWKGTLNQLQISQLSDQEKNQKIDLYHFQIQEIDSARLAEGEEDEMEKLLPQLKNSERLRELSNELYSQLYDAEGSVLERIRKSQKVVESISNLGVELKDAPIFLEDALIKVNEVVNDVETFRNGLVIDPKKVDEIISRQDLIFKLKKKYGKTIPEILEYRGKIGEELKRLEGHTEAIQELQKNAKESHTRLSDKCRKLTVSRRKCSEKLSDAVEKELKELGFHKARFSIQFTAEKDDDGKEIPTPNGFERAEFLFSANPGEELKPLKQVASGGELSRVMLAIKKILAQSDVVPTLIFDEIDSGIGGSMGNVVGEKLKTLSRSHQILVVTHLPQIAAYTGHHITVRKSVTGDRTRTTIELLKDAERIREIARMLGGTSGDGEEPTAASLKHASELLQNAK